MKRFLCVVISPKGAHTCANAGLPEEGSQAGGRGHLRSPRAEHPLGRCPERLVSSPCCAGFGGSLSAWPAALTLPERGPGVSEDENN